MNINPSAIRHTASKTATLSIRFAETPADWQLAHSMLDEEHLLGAGREAGDRLCQFILEEDRIVAVLIWCAAAWHLQDRDTMIGWDPVCRSQRLKLVVQLRRFLVPEKNRRPNLASQCLGLGLRELPAHWHAEHGYRPLMAESFSDPESHHGTVYKATNWTCAGATKGFSQDHTDYYLPNGRPKKLWLKPLAQNACALLCAPELPDDCKAGLTDGGGARSPLKLAELKTLREAFALVPDPRRPQSRRHPLTAMLTLIALGMLMGGRDMLNIWRKAAKLDQRQRAAIGLKVRHKESRLLTMPGYDALNDLMNAIDPKAYAAALTEWLQVNTGILPRSLAFDGKSIGDGKCGMIITLCRHEDGRPVAMIPATGEKEDSEPSESRALLADPQVCLENALITADPLHNKEPTLRVIVEKGGDYLVGTKGNTAIRYEAVEKALESTPFFDLSYEDKNNHGRIDKRSAAVKALEPVDAGLLSAHSAIKVRREWVEKTCPENEHEHTRSFISSLMPDEGERLGWAARTHWSVENKNHHKRDHHVWQEDRHRHRRVNVAQNLALTRNALLAIIPFDEKKSLPTLIIDYQDRKQFAIDLILKAKPFP